MTTPGDEGLPERLLDAARGYHAPGDVPREEMWSAIAAGRARRAAEARRLRQRVRWGLALAATLALGIGIGRMVTPGGPFRTASAVPAVPATASGTAYRVAAGQYLVKTEVLLTDFHGERRRGRLDPEFLASARDLLTTTRLMLDSPAGDDPRLAGLLQDIELVLAQISQLQTEPGQRGELDLIDQSIHQSSVLTRLRAATPGAGAPTRTEGVL
jgi:hypothetical protein